MAKIPIQIQNNTASDVYINDSRLGFTVPGSSTINVENFIEIEILTESSVFKNYLTSPPGTPDLTVIIDGVTIAEDDVVSALTPSSDYRITKDTLGNRPDAGLQDRMFYGDDDGRLYYDTPL